MARPGPNMSKPAAPPLVALLQTPSLRLAIKWAEHRGDGVSVGAAVYPNGRVEPVVRVHHGPAPIYIRDLGKCLLVMGYLEVPEAVRVKLAAAPSEERSAFLYELREILMSCPRIGFALAPGGVSESGRIERVGLDQTLQVAENDPGSFNRFCDAVQETETVLLRVLERMRAFAAHHEPPSTYSSGTAPPTDIYR